MFLLKAFKNQETVIIFVSAVAFKTCAVCFSQFKQSRCGCASAVLILMSKPDVCTRRWNTPVNTRGSLPISRYHCVCVCLHVCVRVRILKDTHLPRWGGRELLCLKHFKGCCSVRWVYRVSSAVDHIHRTRTQPLLPTSTQLLLGLSQAVSPVSHSCVIYCQVHRARAQQAVLIINSAEDLWVI